MADDLFVDARRALLTATLGTVRRTVLIGDGVTDALTRTGITL